jgi:colanic acid/amylovoran biosynthesis protein
MDKIKQQTKKTKVTNICLFGAMPDTNNLGVSALCFSSISNLLNRLPDANLTVFGFENDIKPKTYVIDHQTYRYNSAGAVYSRRYYRRNNLWNMRLSALLGGFGNPVVKIIANANAVLDLSQGDSFTDMYGPKRFSQISFTKLIALQQKRPLILLPQTYGPFNTQRCRSIAKYIVQNSAAAWARDERSFNSMRELLGDCYNADRHHSGVDVAFSLPLAKPQKRLSDKVSSWLKSDRKQPTIGLNISGLIFNDPNSAVSRYKFCVDYREVIIKFLRLLLQKTDVNILLVPHVLAPTGNYESDPDANNNVAKELAAIADNRLEIIPPDFDQSETKWIISHCDWFCGMRMHSTIAGLSTGVPTTAIAYSLKTQGVFETCGQGDHVVDPRYLSTEDVVAGLFRSFQQYKKTKEDLGLRLPAVKKRADLQMDQIAEACLTPEMNSNF